MNEKRNEAEAATSGQNVHKSRKSKFRQESEQPRPADKLRHEDAPPTEETVPPEGKAKPDKDAQRLNKSKLRMGKQGAKLDKAKEKLAAQKPLKNPGLVKKTGRVVGRGVQGFVHGKIFQVEDENVGVEGAHRSELVGEAALRGTSRFLKKRIRTHPARAVRKAEAKSISARVDYQFRAAAAEHPELNKNMVSRFLQKRQLKKQYAKQVREATRQGAKAAEKTAVTTEKLSSAAVGFVKRHPTGVLIALACFLLLVAMQSCASTMVTLGNGLVGSVGASTYPTEEGDLRGAEAAYVALETELQDYLDSYERTHSYDEYHYDLAEIKHDPYVLLAIVSALHEGQWTVDEVQGTLQMLFDKQYLLTECVTVETHYDADDEPYPYYICTVTLKNEDLSHLPIYIMGEEPLSWYALYMATLGNRPDLFPESGYVDKYVTNRPADYEVPEEYLTDETFAAILTEAEKYLGYPYVWGGYTPATSFDCSGFVSWVINHSGWDVGRLGATSLYNICTPTSSPRPGDLVFFVGTYDTAGMSHCGIYVGDGMMLHCGDPIQYANLNSSYWQSHCYAYGRLP